MIANEGELADFDQLWDYSNPEESEKRFRQLLPKAMGNLSYHMQLLTQIARAQGLQREFEQAHGTLDEVQGMLADDLIQARVRYLLERGRVFNSSNDPDQARPLFLEVWELASTTGEDFYAIDAAHMMGIIEPPEVQLEWNLKALELAEETSDPRSKKWLASLYNNIGWTYHGQERYEEALQLFEKALKRRDEEGSAPEIRIAKWCVARALRSLQQVDEALDMQKALLAEHESIGEKSGYVYEEMAECLLCLNHPSEAQGYFALAYEELSEDPWLVVNESARLDRLRELGKVG